MIQLTDHPVFLGRDFEILPGGDAEQIGRAHV